MGHRAMDGPGPCQGTPVVRGGRAWPPLNCASAPSPKQMPDARLVAAAVARRAGVEEAVLDEVRLAVGEACSRAVGLHRSNGLTAPVRVVLTEEDKMFSIEVGDEVPGPAGTRPTPVSGIDAVPGPDWGNRGRDGARGDQRARRRRRGVTRGNRAGPSPDELARLRLFRPSVRSTARTNIVSSRIFIKALPSRAFFVFPRSMIRRQCLCPVTAFGW